MVVRLFARSLVRSKRCCDDKPSRIDCQVGPIRRFNGTDDDFLSFRITDAGLMFLANDVTPMPLRWMEMQVVKHIYLCGLPFLRHGNGPSYTLGSLSIDYTEKCWKNTVRFNSRKNSLALLFTMRFSLIVISSITHPFQWLVPERTLICISVFYLFIYFCNSVNYCNLLRILVKC